MPESEDVLQAFCPSCGETFAPAGRVACPDHGDRLHVYYGPELETGGGPLVGASLGDRFELKRLLGSGTMGRVYYGVQTPIDRDVAVKVLRSEHLEEETIVQRFRREARVVSEFSHPNIVKMVDFGRERSRELLYLVMELVEGLSLEYLLERSRRLAPSMAIEVARQACNALAASHRKQVVHRDLKPDNLMLSALGDGRLQATVLDFGIAHVVQPAEDRLTGAGDICGTAYYMAPEQTEGQTVTEQSDLYALGVILFRMLTGEFPFEVARPSEFLIRRTEVETRDLRETYRRVCEADAETGAPRPLPDGLVRLVDCMLETSPDERPASALDVRDTLEPIQHNLGGPRLRLEVDQPLPTMFDEWLLGHSTGTPVPDTEETTDDIAFEETLELNDDES
jgi:serine/threonine-protein kinase